MNANKLFANDYERLESIIFLNQKIFSSFFEGFFQGSLPQKKLVTSTITKKRAKETKKILVKKLI